MKRIPVQLGVTLVLGVLVSLGGCATRSASGSSYPRYETRTAYDVEYGEVVATRIVEIEGDASYIGVWGGAEVGRAAGSTVADGDTGRVARALGGVAGAVAGEAIEKKITAEDGLEITVRLDSSNTIAVVQEQDVLFSPGDRVRVLFGPRGSTRITVP
jgi:outer membrane lipoprotein SlyB